MDTRKTAILELLEQARQVNVRELAIRFAVSEMTVRRDLDELQKQGLALRTHGGAVSTGRLRFIQMGLPNYQATQIKAAIGKLAAGLVAPGQTVMIDTGTTALEVARHLPQDMGITVATTSLCVAQDLYDSSVNVLLLGGFLRHEFPSVYGPMTEKLLNDLRVDVLFIGCDGADSRTGFYSNDLHISSLEQAMIRIADKVVVVTESGKFGRRAFARYATVDQVHTLITDSQLSPVDREQMEENGIAILVARADNEAA
ncbi:MAG: DeoR/GlpR family DNA-binding transcription regulator [Armatimonadetes bacterium]|nr:DeoR/GlpR family DNA-binding transcription regulator [Armatimonadota bacterium]